jgi:hypothetical protein
MAKELIGISTRRSRDTIQSPILPTGSFKSNEQTDKEADMDMSLLSRFPAYSTVPTAPDRSLSENSVRFTGIEAEKCQTTGKHHERRREAAKKRVGRQAARLVLGIQSSNLHDSREVFPSVRMGSVRVCENGR